MTEQALRSIRMILLVLVVLLLGMTAYLYFQTGKLNLGSIIIALGCLMIYFVTARKQGSGKQ